MFGYVRPLREEMKVRDWESWRQNYCGLCRCLGKRCGFTARFILNYDMTFFYSLLVMGQDRQEKKKCWCPACVLGRKDCRAEDDALRHTADLTVILSWWKLQDEQRDGSFFRKLAAGMAKLLLRRAYKKASMRLPGEDALIRRQLSLLNELEMQRCDSIDRTADAFAGILRGFAAWWKTPEQRRPAEQLLYHVGRWIYLTDALDDLQKDCSRDRYNPLRYRFTTENGRLRSEDQAYLLQIMDASVDLAAAAFELMDRGRAGAIPENIIYYGLPSVLKAVSEGSFHRRKKQVRP